MNPTPTTCWAEAANALADILEAENAALQATDLAAAARLLAAKRVAIERMELALPTGPKHEIRQAAGRLDRLTRLNSKLLAHGISIQAQVLGIIANAIHAASAAGYGPSGHKTAGFGGYALSAKA